MDFVQKALWFVESHKRDTISLEEIADVCEVSPFHLTRTFAATMGVSLMRYVRARRLSEAARQLALGNTDILYLALEVGYGSHEAFTRAFRDQFALSPEQIRAQGHLNNITLVAPITMNAVPISKMDPPRFETLKPKVFVGLVERYDCQSPGGIPDQWQRFVPYLGNIPGQVGDAAYGINFNFDKDGNFDLMSGVEVIDLSNIPKGLNSLRIPAQRYAVFSHKDHIAGIRASFAAIWNKLLPESGVKAVEGPNFERYGSEFNPKTGLGGLEIWIPIEG
ncbi:GyrI-like small molecule binding domain protein [Leptospira inadai serovar Lyme str. 10]|uniref:GyrI-like small molecule binding domain protein n=2 Tax=Leptospira inadai serovar Lyme TaxID=293084 RepID=V6HHE6_9LEPT|nr:AraC family transcriptional regulator [Leptospira inadai]EQA35780.1 GyrI-like small molecule binding domain protein [Leptospira inadai serovar Lyme str. 10]PNV76836.1 AraC family transcriptional regulator [Leptospira inadai serovar Lyme]